VFWNLTRMAET